jgi:NAD(P)H-nitrite reductase large subunit
MKICIIGAGAGGRSACEQLWELDKEAHIDIFSTQTEIGYAPCELPFAMRGTFTDWDGIFYPRKFFQQRGINVHLESEVTDILRDEKQVIAGGKRHAYDKLILSMGATPSTPDIPGTNGENEFAMNTNISKWKALEEIIRRYSSAAVIGSGAIGIEIAQALKERGYKGVHLLEIMDHILPSAFDRDMAERLEKIMRESGVDLILSAQIKKVVSHSSKKRIILRDRELEVELLIFATGAHPNIDPAEKAGIKIGKTGAIAVNQYLQTSDPDIYAVGDCMENWDVVTGAKTRRLMVTTAQITGSVAAINLLNGNTVPYRGTTMTFIMDLSGHQVGAVGFTEESARNMGFDVAAAFSNSLKTRPAYGGKPVYCKFIADRRTQTFLGGQVISQHEIGGIINELAVALAERIPLADFCRIDTPYSPLVGPDPGRRAMARLLAKLS